MEGVPFCPRCGAKQAPPLSQDEIGKNPYEILQISSEAEPEVIEAAYKSLARKYHPDILGTSASTEKMKDINWAHGLLSNPVKKAEWDSKHVLNASTSGSPPEPFKWQSSGITPRSTQASVSSPQVHNRPPSSTTYKKGRQEQSLKTKKKPWGWLIVICIGLFYLLYYYSTLSGNNSRTSISPRSNAATPEFSSRSQSTPTPECISWKEISLSSIDKKYCIFGIVKTLVSTSQFKTVIGFSDDPSDFIMYDVLRSYPDLEPGLCVLAKGYVEEMDQKPALNIHGSLYDCSQ